MVSFASGMGHVIALMDDGTIFVWGSNYRGQLGTGDLEDRQKPTKLHFPFEAKIVRVFCGNLSSAALTEKGTLYFWGNNGINHFGVKEKGILYHTPRKVYFLCPPPSFLLILHFLLPSSFF
jgi:alpha-tubulin suppressor-like RCC1 family protein